MATNQPTGEKTAFIRTQPAELSTAEVIANAKAAGLSVTSTYVRRVRTAAKQATKRARPAKPAGAGKAAKRSTRARRSKMPSAATTARSEAMGANPNEGTAVLTPSDGHTASRNDVPVARATGRKARKSRNARKVAAANPPQAKRGPGRPRKTSTAIVPSGKTAPPAPTVLSAAAYVAPVAPPPPENHFRALIGELGLMRATQLLEDERNRVAKLLRP